MVLNSKNPTELDIKWQLINFKGYVIKKLLSGNEMNIHVILPFSIIASAACTVNRSVTI